METDLEKLKDILCYDSYNDDVEKEWYIDGINEINSKFNLDIPISKDSIELIAQTIYNTDNVELLEYFVLHSIFDWNDYECDNDFATADWVEDNEDKEWYDENYGEQGTDYFFLPTKNKILVLSQLRMMDLPYSVYEIIDKGTSPNI